MHYAKERDECRAELFTWSQPSALPWILKECGIHRETSLARVFPRSVLGRGCCSGEAQQSVPESHSHGTEGCWGERAGGWTDRRPGLGVLWVFMLLSHGLCSGQGVAVLWHCWALPWGGERLTCAPWSPGVCRGPAEGSWARRTGCCESLLWEPTALFPVGSQSIAFCSVHLPLC